MSDATISLRFAATAEAKPGEKCRAIFERFWPAYQTWYLKEGEAARPSYAACARALKKYMPELVDTWEALVEQAGGSDIVARFLSLYCPPPYLTGCSQAIWSRDRVALLRNYDYSPRLADAQILLSAFTGRRVLAMSDCLWGVLDGINDAGLAMALAFGGRRVVGQGFGIALIVRYCLEMAQTTRQAVKYLTRVPVHMAYNVAIVDAKGNHATVYVSPDRKARVTRDPTSANHQGEIEWPEHAEATETILRERFMRGCVTDGKETLDAFADRFLKAPLYRSTYRKVWGTLYTAVYRPDERLVDYRWLDHVWRQSIDRFDEGEHVVTYPGAGPEPPLTFTPYFNGNGSDARS